jgi:flagellar biosynthesis chaperone FliJ
MLFTKQMVRINSVKLTDNLEHFESYEDTAEIEEEQPSPDTEEEEVFVYPEELPEEIKGLLMEKDDKIMRLKMALQELEVLGTQAVDQLSIQINNRDDQIKELEEKVAHLEGENQLLKQSKPSDSEADIYKSRCQELEEKLKKLTLANSKLEETNSDLLKKSKRVEEVMIAKKIPLDTLKETRPVSNETEQMTIDRLKYWVERLRMESKEVPLNLEVTRY